MITYSIINHMYKINSYHSYHSYLSRVLTRHQAAIAEGKPGYHLGVAFSFSPGVGAEGILIKRVK
jgi:hypothetical protein